MSDFERTLNTHWDYVVVGTGIGGATMGHALVKAGKSVLFLERGRAHFRHPDALRGQYPEMLAPLAAPTAQPSTSTLLQAGRYPDALADGGHLFTPMIGCGSGGSSALYGMAMERFLPSDLGPLHPGQTTAAESRCVWPISYADLAPWYSAAEVLYRVRGGRDPMRPGEADLPPAPALSAQAAELQQHFAQRGLHPYALPLACERLPDCACCQGFLCARDCKNDAGRICLLPALEHPQARLLDECEVLRLEADKSRVTGIICQIHGRQVALRARQVVLAAGALNTPALLLRSTSVDWPAGLANRSGQVGRNLMRHFVDLYLVFTHTGGSHSLKEIGLSDFYAPEQYKLGTLQSFGQLPPASMLVDSLGEELARSAPWAVPLFKIVRPALRAMLPRVFQRGMLLAAIMEDAADPENRVTPGPPMAIRYRPGTADLDRLRVFRALVARSLRPYRFLRLQQAEKNSMLAHVCGTCRFGLDPSTSVLNGDNRAHDVENLYVVDASFFPSSGGTNPGLTIAANALRVAHRLLAGSAMEPPK